MRVLVTLAHPAHVHLFKNFIKEFEKRGHELKIILVKKDINEELIKQLDIPHDSFEVSRTSIPKRLISILNLEIGIYRIAKEFKPDIMMGMASYYITHIGKLLSITTLIF